MSDAPDVDPVEAAVNAAWSGQGEAEQPSEPAPATDTPPAPPTPTEQEAQEEQPQEPPKGPARDAQGKFAPRESKPSAPTGPPAPPLEEAPPPKPAVSEAPRVLPPAVKESWVALPQHVRDFITKREGDSARRESETAAMRQGFAEYQEAVAPYRHLFTLPPAQAVQNTLQTVAVLRTGTAEDKAQMMARIISTFGVDVQRLAHHLDNPAEQPQRQQEQYRDPRVDQLLAQQQQQQVRQVQTEMERWAKGAEFFHYPAVQQRMAQLMPPDDGSPVAERLQRAYDGAVWSLAETREVLSKRPPKGTAPAATPEAKRAAASSIRSSPAPIAASGKPKSVEESVHAAWEEQRKRTQ